MRELADWDKHLEAKFYFDKETIVLLKEQILVSFQLFRRRFSARLSTEKVVTDIQAKMAKSENQLQQIFSKFYMAQESLAGHIDVMEKKTVSAVADKLKLC